MGKLDIRKYSREEEDGTKTIACALECGGILKMHNHKGPALVNKKQDVSEYYLYGVKHTEDEWKKKIKTKAY